MSDAITEGHMKSAATQRLMLSKVIQSFKDLHGDTYDYSKMLYIRNKTKIEIVCKLHGSFWQAPGDHKRGSMCPICAIDRMSLNKRKPLADVICDFKKVHANKYNYSKVNYQSAWYPIEIICKVHGSFEQAPEHHRRGSGCPACTASGFNPLKPGLLYYVRVYTTSGPLYKIGITNRTVKDRFGPDMPLITVLKTWHYDVGADAYQAEQSILKLNSAHKYYGVNVLRCGNTELFTRDVGELDE